MKALFCVPCQCLRLRFGLSQAVYTIAGGLYHASNEVTAVGVPASLSLYR